MECSVLTGHCDDDLGTHVVCEHRGRTQVIGEPRDGCTCWQPEPGSDD
jgi:hypothetical protein